MIAFQICWRLWSTGWNRTDEFRKPRILYLADRNVLVDDPKDKTFAPWRRATRSSAATLARVARSIFRPIRRLHTMKRDPDCIGSSRDFFDLVVVDECQRGSAKDTGNWREILEYFAPAVQLGMTATPLPRGQQGHLPILRKSDLHLQLAFRNRGRISGTVRVHRVVTTVDAAGLASFERGTRPVRARDPDQEYGTRDFERGSMKVRNADDSKALNCLYETH